jgi:hypothetical protein
VNLKALWIAALSALCLPLSALAATAVQLEILDRKTGEVLPVHWHDVVVPLANAALRAKAGDGRGSVVLSGNAVESFLVAYGTRVTVDVSTKAGINSKADELSQNGKLPKKLLNVSKYLGHIRNAADHGIDAEIGAPWIIRPATGLEYVFVACSFIAAVIEREIAGPFEI